MDIWIDNCVLNWNIESSTIYSNCENIKECYDYLNHAETLIEEFNDKYHTQDCIKNLKYIVDKRIKQIERIYDFKSYFPKQHILKTYSELGIVKGLVIRKLFVLRNNIEHNELEYTNIEECRDLLDTVWYFLKSTDILIYESYVSNELCNQLDNNNWIEIDLKNPKFINAKISGKVNKNLISHTKKNNFLKITNNEIFPIDENIFFITGNIFLTKEIKIMLAKKFFIDRVLN